MKNFLKTLVSPKSRRGKIRLATIIGLLGTFVGVHISPEIVFPSIGTHNHGSPTNEVHQLMHP